MREYLLYDNVYCTAHMVNAVTHNGLGAEYILLLFCKLIINEIICIFGVRI